MPDRMPPIPARRMTPEQKAAAQAVASSPRGAVIGPFIPALRSPEFMTRLQHLGEYLRYHTALGPKLGELVILLTARHWTQNFEWHVHAPLALKHGLAKETVAAIARGQRPLDMPDDEALVHDFFMELLHNHSVSDPTYTRAVKQFGEQAIIDLTGAVGYYSTLAMLMTVARTPLPNGAKPGLTRFPGDETQT
jgi:4-carboxymuconolactone decarboxylase